MFLVNLDARRTVQTRHLGAAARLPIAVERLLHQQPAPGGERLAGRHTPQFEILGEGERQNFPCDRPAAHLHGDFPRQQRR